MKRAIRIGFSKDVLGTGDDAGIWYQDVFERAYKCDVVRNTRRWQASNDSTNDDLTLSNQISIVADSFAQTNLYCMKYVKYLGTCWKISDATLEIDIPRILLTLGGVYNGQQASTASNSGDTLGEP